MGVNGYLQVISSIFCHRALLECLILVSLSFSSSYTLLWIPLSKHTANCTFIKFIFTLFQKIYHKESSTVAYISKTTISQFQKNYQTPLRAKFKGLKCPWLKLTPQPISPQNYFFISEIRV